MNHQISKLTELGPTLCDEFTSLGIENSSLVIVSDMVSPENSVNAFKIILKIAKSHKSIFYINSDMKDVITTRVQGKDVVVGLRDKKNWEKHTTAEQREDKDFQTKFSDGLKDKNDQNFETPYGIF